MSSSSPSPMMIAQVTPIFVAYKITDNQAATVGVMRLIAMSSYHCIWDSLPGPGGRVCYFVHFRIDAVTCSFGESSILFIGTQFRLHSFQISKVKNYFRSEPSSLTT
jgi:hypothetical protein